MAEVTIAGPSDANFVEPFAMRYQGLRHQVVGFDTGVDDDDNYTFQVAGLAHSAWEAATAGDYGSTGGSGSDATNGTVSFRSIATTGSTGPGYVHLWFPFSSTGGAESGDPTLLTSASSDFRPRDDTRFDGLLHRTFWVSGASDADTWTSGIPGIRYLAWEVTNNNQRAAARLTTVGTGLITFSTSAASREGVLHVWSAN